MFSMCGLLCRFLRGWRQSEAVGLMVHAASLRDASLVVETIETASKSLQDEESHSLFCQPFCKTETRRQQLLWHDNNKQSTLVMPKEKVDLARWTLFLSSSSSNKEECFPDAASFRSSTTPVATPVSSSPASSRKNSACSECENVITVLLEASYREKEEESLYGYHVMVEQLAEPYAWKARDVFGVIIHTTPTKLVSMIHAFFNNALIIDDNLSIRKILTVDLVGEPSTLRDPSTISDCVTPGPWSHSGNLYTQMELARATNIVSPGTGYISMRALNKEQLKGESTLKKKEKSLVEPKHPSLVEAQKVSSSQSSEEEGSSESDIAPLELHQLCPRGWAVSGLKPRFARSLKMSQKVILGQPLSMNRGPGRDMGLVPQGNVEITTAPRFQPSSLFTSIISNPLNDFLAVKENLTQRARINREIFCQSKSKRSAIDLSKVRERFFAQKDLTNPLLHYLPQVHQTSGVRSKEALGFSPKLFSGSSPHLLRPTLSFHGRENFGWRSSTVVEEKRTNVVIREPKSHSLPAKMKSEADLLKTSNLIKDNLANIVENYLRKSPEVPQRSVETKTIKEMKDPKVLLINNDNDDETNTESILMVTMEETSHEVNDLSKTFDPVAAASCSDVPLPSSQIDLETSTHHVDHLPYSRSADSFYLKNPGSSRSSCPNIFTSFSNTNFTLTGREEFPTKVLGGEPVAADSYQRNIGQESMELAFWNTENTVHNLDFNPAVGKTCSNSESAEDGREKLCLIEGQESVESDITEQSFSEDSLNEKLVPEDKVRCPHPVTSSFSALEVQPETEQPLSGKVSRPKFIQVCDDHVWEKESPNRDQEAISTASKETMTTISNLNNDENSMMQRDLHQSLAKADSHSSNSEEVRGQLSFVESLAEMLSSEIDTSSPLDDSVKSLCNSISFEDNSFSEDSLASAKVFETFGMKQSPLPSSNIEMDSLVSTPEDFTAKTDCIDDLSATGLPMHWHEEYVKVFSDVNQDLRESLQHSAVEITPASLEPIKELESVNREGTSLSAMGNESDKEPLKKHVPGFGDEMSDSRSSFSKGTLSNTLQISYFSKNKLQTILEAQSVSKSEEDIHSPSEDSPSSSPYLASFSSAVSMETGERIRNVDVTNSIDSDVSEFIADAKVCGFNGLKLQETSVGILNSQHLLGDDTSNKGKVAESSHDEREFDLVFVDNLTHNSINDSPAVEIVNPIEDENLLEEKVLPSEIELKSLESFSVQELTGSIQKTQEEMQELTCFISELSASKNGINEMSSDDSNLRSEHENQFITECSYSNGSHFIDLDLNDSAFKEDSAELTLPLLYYESSTGTSDITAHKLESSESSEEYSLSSEAKEGPIGHSIYTEGPSERVLSTPGDKEWLCMSKASNLQGQNEFQNRQDDGFGDIPTAQSQGGLLQAFLDTCGDSSHNPENIEARGAACSSDLDTSSFMRSDEAFVFSPVPKGLSPVDSAPESGFASLKDSSHSEATSESGSGVPLSKSKDSLEMTDSERDRPVGMDVLLDEFDSFSGAPGSHHPPQTGSSPASVVNSSRGSLMDDIVFGHSKELETLDIENVRIPSNHTHNDLFSLTSPPIVPKRGKLMSVASLDSDHRPSGFFKFPEHFKVTSRTTDPFNLSGSLSHIDTSDDRKKVDETTLEESGSQINRSELESSSGGQMSRKGSEDSGSQISKSGSEENEGQILKTSDSISSSDTIISRTSFEEQERNRDEKKFEDICNMIHLHSTDTQSYEKQMKTYFSHDHFNHYPKGDSLQNSPFVLSSELGTTATHSQELMGDVKKYINVDPASGTLLSEFSILRTKSECAVREEELPTSDKNARKAVMRTEEFVLNDKTNYNSFDDNVTKTLKYQEEMLTSLTKNNAKKTRASKTVKPKSLEEVVSKKYSLLSDDRINETSKFLSKSLSDGTSTFSNNNRNLRIFKGTIKRDPNIELSDDSLYSHRTKNTEKNKSQFHSENSLGKSSFSDRSSEGSCGGKDKGFSSRSATYSSSGEILPEKACLRSQDSLDKFTHFDAISAQAKPRTGARRRKVLSMEVESTSGSKKDGHGSEALHRSVTLPAGPLALPFKSKKENKQQRPKDEKGAKKKSKESEGGAEKEKKSSLLSLRGFLRRHKSKETKKDEPGEKKSSPSLFRKFEKKTKSSAALLRSEEKQPLPPKVSISHPFHVSEVDSVSRAELLSEDVVSDTIVKTHLISNGTVQAVGAGVTKPGTKSPLHRSTALPSSVYVSGSESEASSSPGASPLPRKASLTGSPLLYRRVLMRNMSSSQESLDAPASSLPPKNVSPQSSLRRRRASESRAPTSGSSSSVPLMGTRALRASPQRFSVTIGFKSEVKGSPQSRTMSIGEELHSVTASATLPGRGTTSRSPASTLTKRSSSMEILVYGKIREHNPSRKRSTGGCSREGSFKLHREISVETLLEVPEAGVHPRLSEGENYEEYLRRVQESHDSRQSSAWSLCENDGSSLSESLPFDFFLPHNPLRKKLSLPHNLYLLGPDEDMSNSNPNLSRVGSPFSSRLPLSSSFTSSPFRRPIGAGTPSGISPIKKGLTNQGKSSITSPGNDSCPASPLVEEEEEAEFSREVEEEEEAMEENEPSPNILVYTGNNQDYFEDVKETLISSFGRNRYVIYHLTDELAFKSPWKSSTTLLVVCGDVATHVSTVLVRYLLSGGKVLSICSDFLNVAVPLFGTVEVQEAAIVSMSYNRWKNVQLLHHQHCFHSSPKHKRFSKDLEKKASSSGSAVSVEPTFVEITDEYGVRHRLDLTVLAKDDTWGAPSLLVANVNEGNGKALFSQVHLEKDPNKSISLNLRGDQLKRCNESRLEILRDLLCSQLGLNASKDLREEKESLPAITSAYLLGKYEAKQKFFDEMKPYLNEGRLVRPLVTLQIQDSREEPLPSEKLLPILMTGYPSNFSTVKYFEELRTTTIGRLIIYSEVVTSTTDILVGNPPLDNGVVVIATQQLRAKGRRRNTWLSPVGCTMFSLQLHFPVASNMGQRLPFLQHLVALAIVMGVKGISGYETIPLALKWPNDIYLGGKTKIGGVLVEASTQIETVIVNVGCGVNLWNSMPTSCINDAIREHNDAQGTRLPELQRETFCANIFNQMERLLDEFQTRGSDRVIAEYYNHWLHSNVCVSVQNESGQLETATIVGIDSFGFLVAHLTSGETVVLHPDGNSFNMLEGLIYTKL